MYTIAIKHHLISSYEPVDRNTKDTLAYKRFKLSVLLTTSSTDNMIIQESRAARVYTTISRPYWIVNL